MGVGKGFGGLLPQTSKIGVIWDESYHGVTPYIDPTSVLCTEYGIACRTGCRTWVVRIGVTFFLHVYRVHACMCACMCMQLYVVLGTKSSVLTTLPVALCDEFKGRISHLSLNSIAACRDGLCMAEQQLAVWSGDPAPSTLQDGDWVILHIL